ncbi:MAG: nucleotide exchange factor GrpE [Deltaproteobacteria bacterium]|nr:nucleotide exchange factor GrpE [Deltaproteobacteria bacterium]
MTKDQSKGYQVEIPDDVLDEALEVVQKPKSKASQDTEVVVEIEDEDGIEIETAPAAAPAELMAELKEAKEAAKAAKDRMLRVAADADNVRKRAIKEKQDAIKFGMESVMRDLLPIVDNLERTIKHIPKDVEDPTFKTLAEGVRMILLQFTETLRRHNVSAFDSIGQGFDPAMHEALSSKPTAEADPGTVLSEMHRGYVLNDRLLRPALVEVACTPKPSDEDSQDVVDEPAVCREPPDESDESKQTEMESDAVPENDDSHDE